MKTPQNLALYLLFSLTLTMGSCSSSSDDINSPVQTDDTTGGDTTDDTSDDTADDTDTTSFFRVSRYVAIRNTDEGVIEAPQRTFSYNDQGNISKVEIFNSNINDIPQYDANDQIVKVQLIQGGVLFSETTYTYDSNGLVVGTQSIGDVTVPDAFRVSAFTYDEQARVIASSTETIFEGEFFATTTRNYTYDGDTDNLFQISIDTKRANGSSSFYIREFEYYDTPVELEFGEASYKLTRVFSNQLTGDLPENGNYLRSIYNIDEFGVRRIVSEFFPEFKEDGTLEFYTRVSYRESGEELSRERFKVYYDEF